MFAARVVRDGKWFVAFSPELLLIEDRREDARASLGNGEKLIPLVLA